jgi:phosphoglycerate dehydrogenase-like enzyme
VLLHDPYVTRRKPEALGSRWTELDALLAAADVVSLHAPALPETHALLDAARLALMRDGAILINTARGWLVDGDALTAELVSGRLDAVARPTTEPEILPAELAASTICQRLPHPPHRRRPRPRNRAPRQPCRHRDRTLRPREPFRFRCARDARSSA